MMSSWLMGLILLGISSSLLAVSGGGGASGGAFPPQKQIQRSARPHPLKKATDASNMSIERSHDRAGSNQEDTGGQELEEDCGCPGRSSKQGSPFGR